MVIRRPASRRDLTRTRQRIIKAALREFAAKGFAGARTDAIVRRARVNKRMLFHCFGSKTKLYREILNHKLAQRAAVLESTPENLPAALAHWYEAAAADPDWILFLHWEASGNRRKPAAGQVRRELFERALELFERWKRQGLLPPKTSGPELLLSVVALAVFPVAFPQLVWLITGLWPEEERFQHSWRKFLNAVAGQLESGPHRSADTRRAAADQI